MEAEVGEDARRAPQEAQDEDDRYSLPSQPDVDEGRADTMGEAIRATTEATLDHRKRASDAMDPPAVRQPAWETGSG